MVGKKPFKKTFIKDIFRNIKKEFVSWLSIVTIVLMSTLGILVVIASAESLRDNAVEYLEGCNYKNFELYSNVGVSEEDIEYLSGIEGVKDVEGVTEVASSLTFNGQVEDIKIYSPTERVNKPLIKDGKAPKELYECALCEDAMEDMGISLGDTVNIRPANEKMRYVIRGGKYIVTGVVSHPDHMIRQVEYYGLFPDESIYNKALGNDFTSAYIDIDSPESSSLFELVYKDFSDPVRDNIEACFDDLSALETEHMKEVRAEAEKEGITDLPEVDEVRWMCLDRGTDDQYLLLNVSYIELASISLYFTPLFLCISMMVCFSTIMIIVDKHKTQIGTQKALGFTNNKIRIKYLTYGVLGTSIGALIGVIGSLPLENIVKNTGGTRYESGGMSVILSKVTVPLVLLFIIFSVVVVTIACNRMVKCSAVGLMSGEEPKKTTFKKSLKGSYKVRNVYPRLITRNLLTELPRVIVSIIIVMMSVLMIGGVITLKKGIDEAIKRQVGYIWNYDLEATVDNPGRYITIMEDILEKNGTDYIATKRRGVMIKKQGSDLRSIVQMFVLSDEDIEVLEDYYRLEDSSGRHIDVTNDGILVTSEMNERDDLNIGDVIEVTNEDLYAAELKVAGVYTNYFNNAMLISEDLYKELFEDEHGDNYYMINAGPETDIDKLKNELSDLSYVDSVVTMEDHAEQFDITVQVLNVVVFMLMLIIVMLEFMIQLNLSNIQVSTRMKEVLVMRVNGFTMKQVIGYLAREVVVITVLGIIIGIVVGVPFAKVIVMSVEGGEAMFVRTPFPEAWVISAVVSALFSFGINAISYSKIRFVPMTDITKY